MLNRDCACSYTTYSLELQKIDKYSSMSMYTMLHVCNQSRIKLINITLLFHPQHQSIRWSSKTSRPQAEPTCLLCP